MISTLADKTINHFLHW